MPTFLSTFVPVGLMGLCIAAMLAADMSTDSSYMLTWGSVIYNDIMAPFRKTPWSEKKGLFVNRTIIALIGVFLLFYGLWYPLEGDVWTYLGITGTIYLASISVLLISCCYWKRANNWGATGSIIFAAAIPVTVSRSGKNACDQRLCQTDRPVLFGHRGVCLLGAGDDRFLAAQTEKEDRIMKYFWLILTIAAVGWYTFVTIYVAFKGVTDIKEMLKRLAGKD